MGALNLKKMKYIVIEKEKLDKLISRITDTEDDFEVGKRAALRSLELTFGVVDTDQSIVDRAERYSHLINKNDEMREFFAYKEGATEQSLIEQMKAKEFAEWCSINGWHYSTASKGWHTPFHIHDFFTTEELFNQFTNR